MKDRPVRTGPRRIRLLRSASAREHAAPEERGCNAQHDVRAHRPKLRHAANDTALSEVRDLVILQLVEERAVADFEQIRRARPVSLGLLQGAPDENFLDRGGRPLD